MRRLTPYAAASLCAFFYLYAHAGVGPTTTAEKISDSATVTSAATASSEANLSGCRCPEIDPAFIAPTESEATAITETELPVEQSADLPAKLRAAKVSYKPVPKADVLSREVAAENAVRRLDRYLKNAGETGDGWRKYLELSKLQEALDKGVALQPAVVQGFIDRFSDGSDGLELPQFAAVRNALKSFNEALVVYQNATAKAQYEQDLDHLADNLDHAAKTNGQLNRGPTGELLSRVAATGQSSELVAQVKQEVSQPNLRVFASRRIVAGGIDDKLDEPTPIKDVILGTQVTGSGHTTGNVRSALIPNKNKAVIEIQLHGETASKTVGHNGPVTIFSHGTTKLAGKKRIDFDDKEFVGEPANADACTSNNIDNLCICGGFIVQHIATKRVYASKSTGEAIASQHAEARLERRMNEKTADLLVNANRSFDERFRDPLNRIGAYPQMLKFSTTADWLSVIGLQARDNELGANTPAPKSADGAELSIRLHESLIENFAAAIAPGRTARSVQYRRTMHDAMGEPYAPAEFADFVLCLAESGAPADVRDPLLVVKFDQFQSLMKDRFNLQVTEADYLALTKAVHDGTLTEAQFKKYLAGLSRDPISYADTKAIPQNAQINYSGMTFADSQPVSIKFAGNEVQLTLRVASFTQPRLDNDGKRQVNQFPAEIYVTYKIAMNGGKATLTRVDGSYGVRPLGQEDQNLSLRDRTRRSTMFTKTLPRRFFGVGETQADDEDANEEPFFPSQKESTGLTLRGRWQRLGELPWAQISADNGWLALGWTMPPTPPTPQGAE
jgi:hypothetical protein